MTQKFLTTTHFPSNPLVPKLSRKMHTNEPTEATTTLFLFISGAPNYIGTILSTALIRIEIQLKKLRINSARVIKYITQHFLCH